MADQIQYPPLRRFLKVFLILLIIRNCKSLLRYNNCQIFLFSKTWEMRNVSPDFYQYLLLLMLAESIFSDYERQ